MGTIIRITGAIDRNEPDPQAPGDPLSRWIGDLLVAWSEDGPRQGRAALIKVCTGRGIGSYLWGPHVLQLRWIGDPPAPEIAQAAYDYVYDAGPARRPIAKILEAQPGTEAQSSYRVSQARAS